MRAKTVRTSILFPGALLVLAGSAGSVAGQSDHDHSDCPDPGMAYWMYDVGHWHFPGIVAELTQQNGARSEAQLDAVALELVRLSVEPDPDWVVGQIRTHFEGDIREGAEEAAGKGVCYDERDIEWMVTSAIEGQRERLHDRTRSMVAETLKLATHLGWRSGKHPPDAGIPYDGDGAFDAALLLLEETGSHAGLLDDLDPERAAVEFERIARGPGPFACSGLAGLRTWRWGEDEEAFDPHPSYERLRRELRGRCPHLDDPGT